VGEAITHLRENLSPEAEVILGATTEEAMLGRVQAILIVTGLGGKPIPAELVSEAEAAPQEPAPDPVTDDEDLDLPTFLRRRMNRD
jgi:cell division protein FtsZ